MRSRFLEITAGMIAAVAALSLIITAIGADWHFVGLLRGVFLIVNIVAAGGLVWLGWYCVSLIKNINLVSTNLTDRKASTSKKTDQKYKNKSLDAIRRRLVEDSSYIANLKDQQRDSQLQIQLLERQKINVEAILYSIRDAVIVIDEFDRLLMANKEAAKIFSFDFDNCQRKYIDELIGSGGSHFVDFLQHTRKSKTCGGRREIELEIDGKLRTFDSLASSVNDHRGILCGVVGVLHEITKEKEISQMKNNFVNHVSHELKTPLASIMAYSEMLVDGEADDEKTRKEFYLVIQAQAERLTRLIEDVLNISRIESGLVKVEMKPVSLTILIEEQMQMIRNYAEEKSIEIIRPKPIVHDQVYADKDMMSQVIVNLLSNAVKYTNSGGSVTINTEVDENTSVVRVSVIDTGIGIKQDELKHVFDKFYRVASKKTKAKGTGLGLNLVKQIVEKVHGGHVFATSREDIGSTFGFELPLMRNKADEMLVGKDNKKAD